MKRVVAEKYRDIDFSRAKRGPVVKPEPGKTKISIRLDNAVLGHFRDLVDKAGGGNYQTLINDALLEHIRRRSTLDAVRQVVREALAPYGPARGNQPTRSRKRRCVPSLLRAIASARARIPPRSDSPTTSKWRRVSSADVPTRSSMSDSRGQVLQSDIRPRQMVDRRGEVPRTM
jgi:uncharacterized protein (DUF4415 family)